MKKYLICFFISLSLFPTVHSQDRSGDKAYLLSKVIRKYHISPRPLDDSFSLQVYRSTLEKLDPYFTYFTSKDLAKFSVWQYRLDDEIQQKSAHFIQELSTVYEKGLKNADQTIQDLLQTPFSFSEKDFLVLKITLEQEITPVNIRERWKHILKWRTLELLQGYTGESGKPVTQELIKLHEAIARAKMLKQWNEYFRKNNASAVLRHSMIEGVYFSAIANAYDPHTEFMRGDEKKEFEEGLSSEARLFGFNLETDEEGNYRIGEIVPGSSAFQSNSVFEKDKIVSIKTAEGKTILAKDASVEEINSSLGADQESVELTLQSTDGISKNVKLNKSIIRKEENAVRGWILEGERKIGYISLPVFYTRMVEGVGTSCAEDVAREIVKLKKENIEGLILDLRYNGGGSVEEASSLLGIFVDLGPLGMLRLYNGKTEIIKDVNRGQIWSGPVAVMINGASASASELVAATLQDYKKAIVVGSPSFGKATMQVIIPIDSTFDLENPTAWNEPVKGDQPDFVKITIAKIYRINGSSVQKSGVTPDLYLPDRFELLDITERAYSTALLKDTVLKKLNYTVSPAVISAVDLNTFEQNVVLKDLAVQNIISDIKLEKNQMPVEGIPLDLEGFNKYIAAEAKSDSTSSLKTNFSPVVFKVRNSKLDADFNVMEKYQQETDESLMKLLAGDTYLKQSYELIRNILNSKK